jgi:hypothetical protein
VCVLCVFADRPNTDDACVHHLIYLHSRTTPTRTTQRQHPPPQLVLLVLAVRVVLVVVVVVVLQVRVLAAVRPWLRLPLTLHHRQPTATKRAKDDGEGKASGRAPE